MMQRYTRIAVGIDLEPDGRKLCLGSQRAVRQVRDLAFRTGASIAFLHSTSVESGDELPIYHDRKSRELSPSAWAVLESTSHEFADENIHTSLHFTSEPAWLEMSRWAKRGLADLVVVGKRSRTVGDGRQIGTIATKLIRKCPAPVWLVHPDREPGDGCVLAATVVSIGAREAEKTAREEAQKRAEELQTVTEFQESMLSDIDADLMGRSILNDLRERAKERLTERCPDSSRIHTRTWRARRYSCCRRFQKGSPVP